MTDRHAYSYIVLRYVHDVLTTEFINVGIVLYSPKAKALCAKTRKTIGRIKDTFPDLDRQAFTRAMRSIDRSVERISRDIEKRPLLPDFRDVEGVAKHILPTDDSSLQWSPLGTGLTDNPTKTMHRLFSRLVGRYDEHPDRRRTDEEIWRPVRRMLEERHLAGRLQEKKIVGTVDEIAFKHAWKNGQWHVYEPVSLDLADSEGIKEKARRWLGHLAAVAEGGEPFKPHFFVGAPQNPLLQSAYHTALAILGQAPSQPEIFEESQITDLVTKIELEVRSHDNEPS